METGWNIHWFENRDYNSLSQQGERHERPSPEQNLPRCIGLFSERAERARGRLDMIVLSLTSANIQFLHTRSSSCSMATFDKRLANITVRLVNARQLRVDCHSIWLLVLFRDYHMCSEKFLRLPYRRHAVKGIARKFPLPAIMPAPRYVAPPVHNLAGKHSVEIENVRNEFDLNPCRSQLTPLPL